MIDVTRDGYPDLVATSRLPDPGLSIWLGDGKTFTLVERTWANTPYAAWWLVQV